MTGLNPKQVEHLTAPGRYLDGEGLYLVVGATGGKSWLFRFQLNGKRRDMGLGAFPAVALKAARMAAADARSLIQQGRDPLSERHAAKAAQKAVGVTFQALALDYHRTHFTHVTAAWRAGWLSKLERYVFPLLGELAPGAIETGHVLRILKPIWSEKPRTADEVRGHIENVLDSAKALGLRLGENPARWRGHLEYLLSKADKARATTTTHHPAMPWRALPAFMESLGAATDRDSIALQLVVLTAARAGMVRFATWDEFDLDAATWSLPAERMKAREAFVIPLPKQAVELLRAMPRHEGSAYLFPGTGKSRVMSKGAFLKLLTAMKQPDITTHGFRATFRTWAGECTHFPREVCELSLAHDERGQVEAAYSRGDLIGKRRELLQAWADYATTPVAENVIHGAFKRV